MQVTSSTNNASRSVIKSTKLVSYIALLTVLLLSFAIVNRIAANWSNISPDSRLLLGQSVFLLSVLLALFAVWRSKRLADLAIQFSSLAAGALLALIGQIYQTGADSWSLFALWALLITPWLILLRTIFITVLWALLLNITIFLYVSNSSVTMLWLIDGNLWLLLLNLFFLLAVLVLQGGLRDSWFLLRKIFAAATCVFLFLYLLQQQFEGTNIIWQYLLAYVGLSLAYVWFTRKDRDLFVVSCIFLTAIGLAGLIVFQLANDIQAVLLLAVIVLLASAFASFKLVQLWRVWFVAKSNAGFLPWYFYVLRVGALLLVAILFLVWLLFSFDFASREQLITTALVILFVGLLTARLLELKLPEGPYSPNIIYEAALVAVFAGFALFMAVWLLETNNSSVNYRVLQVLAIGCVVYLILANPVSRFLSAVIVVGACLWLVNTEGFLLGGMPLDLWPISASYFLCLFLLLAFYLYSRPVRQAYLQPLALALFAWAVLLAIACDLLNSLSLWHWPPGAAIAVVAISCLPWLFALPMVKKASRPGTRLYLSALLLLMASVLMAGAFTLSLSLALLAYTAGRQMRAFAVLWAVLAIVALPLYYFQTATSLGFKSIQFLLVALTMFMALLSIGLKPAKNVFYMRTGKPYILVTVFAAVAIIGLAQYQIRSYESILQDGKRVVLQLAPVDPRSLMQGDYMQLDYALRNDANNLLLQKDSDLEINENKPYWILLTTNNRDLSELFAIADSFDDAEKVLARDSNITILKARFKHGRLDWGANSWFFAEGMADKFARAEFGVLRVAKDGTAMLSGLLDENMQKLD